MAELAEKASNSPAWFTHGGVVAGLGLLSLFDYAADKSQEIRELMDDFSVYAKTGLSGLTTLGVMNTADADFAGSGLQQAGFMEMLPPPVSAVATYFGANIRGGVKGVLTEADPDDVVNIRGFISWVEGFFAVGGAVVLILRAACRLVIHARVLWGAVFAPQALRRKARRGQSTLREMQ